MTHTLQNALLPARADASHAHDGPGQGKLVSSADEARTDIARTARDAPSTGARPFWLGGQCRVWCTETHRDSDFYDDRVHSLSRPGKPIALSLHEPWHVPAQVAGERVDDIARPAKSGPVHIDVSAFWHYRHAEPEIDLTVPKLDEKDRPDGEAGVHLTVSEARALRGALTQVIVTLGMSRAAVLDVPEPGANEPTCSDRQEVVLVDGAGEHATLSSELVWWPGEPVGVLLNVMDIPVNCTPKQAREAASSLRVFADTVDAHAGQVEALQVAE
jgi:hypothetical protein